MNKSGFMEYQGRIKLDGMSPEAFEAASKWGYFMSRILGASGWITFVYLILHAYAAVILGVMRLLVWLWQYVIA